MPVEEPTPNGTEPPSRSADRARPGHPDDQPDGTPDVEARLTALEARVQALEGRADRLRAVNDEVRASAEAALARTADLAPAGTGQSEPTDTESRPDPPGGPRNGPQEPNGEPDDQGPEAATGRRSHAPASGRQPQSSRPGRERAGAPDHPADHQPDRQPHRQPGRPPGARAGSSDESVDWPAAATVRERGLLARLRGWL